MANTLFGRDMAVDLGTANTLVYERGAGIVLNEPSVVAVNTDDRRHPRRRLRGEEDDRAHARQHRRHPPAQGRRDRRLRDDRADAPLLHPEGHQRAAGSSGRASSSACPRASPGVERRAVEEAPTQAGARRVYIIEEPMAAAIGAGLPVHEPTGNMVVDIGGGTTEVAVISLGGIVTAQSIRVGGDELDAAIIHLRQEGVRPHARRADRRGDQDGDRLGVPDSRRAARGDPRPRPGLRAAQDDRRLRRGVRRAIEEPVNTIVDAVKTTLDKCPPELSGDIMDRGIVLTGGGALLAGMDERLRHETGMPIRITEDPLNSVALGRWQVRGGVRGSEARAHRRTASLTSRPSASRRAQST